MAARNTPHIETYFLYKVFEFARNFIPGDSINDTGIGDFDASSQAPRTAQTSGVYVSPMIGLSQCGSFGQTSTWKSSSK